jgi:hypothetical protein
VRAVGAVAVDAAAAGAGADRDREAPDLQHRAVIDQGQETACVVAVVTAGP